MHLVMRTVPAKIISLILHPIIMQALGMIVIFNSGTYLSYLPFDAKSIIFLVVVLCTIIIPLSLLTLFLYQKLIMNIQIESRKERFFPFITVFLFYSLCYVLLRRVPVPPAYYSFMLGCSVAILCITAVSVFWKISAHMTGIGGITGLIIFLIWSQRVNLQFLLILSIISAGMIGYARLQIRAHNSAQVYSGFFAGLFSVGLTMMIY